MMDIEKANKIVAIDLNDPNILELLEIPPGASDEDVKSTRAKLLRMYHPDHNQKESQKNQELADSVTKKIVAAFDYLNNDNTNALEKKRKAEEEQRKAEAERKAEEAKQKAEAERKAEEEQRKAKAERKAEEARQKSEAEAKAKKFAAMNPHDPKQCWEILGLLPNASDKFIKNVKDQLLDEFSEFPDITKKIIGAYTYLIDEGNVKKYRDFHARVVNAVDATKNGLDYLYMWASNEVKTKGAFYVAKSLAGSGLTSYFSSYPSSFWITGSYRERILSIMHEEEFRDLFTGL